ncbi:MAG: hypothetical protein GXO21_08265, partial [Aquificae bacterium]|nr:hypothetical protein [Aquificota bacterium]
WKQLSDIDWFTNFVKAWIAFNAWYRNHYPNIKTDRKILEEIKRSSNIKSKFNSLLNGSGEKHSYFREQLGFLHYKLQNKEIKHKGIRLSFEEYVNIDKSSKGETLTYRNIEYEIVRNSINTEENYVKFDKVKVKNRNGYILNLTDLKINYESIYKYKDKIREFIIQDNKFRKLSLAQKEKIINIMTNELNPFKIINFLQVSNGNFYKFGNFKFIKEQDLIFSALIDILYSLRNVLFHGEIIPDRETNEVYEPAYKILKMLID